MQYGPRNVITLGNIFMNESVTFFGNLLAVYGYEMNERPKPVDWRDMLNAHDRLAVSPQRCVCVCVWQTENGNMPMDERASLVAAVAMRCNMVITLWSIGWSRERRGNQRQNVNETKIRMLVRHHSSVYLFGHDACVLWWSVSRAQGNRTIHSRRCASLHFRQVLVEKYIN